LSIAQEEFVASGVGQDRKETLQSQLTIIMASQRSFGPRRRMSDLTFVSWKEIFQKAVEETDREKQRQLVQQADFAIFQRQQKLYDCIQHREELNALNAATDASRRIEHAAREVEQTAWVRFRAKSA
jgi:hypothetical protein